MTWEAATPIQRPLRISEGLFADLAQLRRDWGCWLLLVVIILLQWGLFRQYVLREIVGGYPQQYDQVSYLSQSYNGYTRMIQDGILAGLAQIFHGEVPNGLLLQMQASLLFLFIGASRMSALSINFIYFAALQCALLGTIRWLTGRWNLALLGVGLLTMTLSPFLVAGGMSDFRIDFSVFCLFGMLICTVVRSGLFASLRWSIAVGVVAALVVLSRYITVLYIVGIFGTVLLFLGAQWRWFADAAARQRVAGQLRGFGLAAAIFVLLITPVLWYKRTVFLAYYVGQTTTRAPIRAAEMGITSQLDALLYYPYSLRVHHLGTTFLTFIALILVLCVAALAVSLWRARVQLQRPAWGAYLFFIVMALSIPFAAFTSNAAKSPVVGNILVVPLIWLVVMAVWYTTQHILPHQRLYLLVRPGVTLLAGAALVLGLQTHLSQQSRSSLLSQQREDSDTVIQLYTDMGEYSSTMGWFQPRISSNANLEYLFPALVEPLFYEQRGILLSIRSIMGHSIFAMDAAATRAGLEQSDFVILADFAANEQLPFPFNQSMQQLRPMMLEYCERELLPLNSYTVFGRQVTLYARPKLLVSTEDRSWVTETGIGITGPAPLLDGQDTLSLQGALQTNYLSKTPTVRAALLLPNHSERAVPARFTSTDGAYRIDLDLRQTQLPATGVVRLKLLFDTYFVPQQIGLNADRRRLVVPVPSAVTATKGSPLPWEPALTP